MLDPRAHQPNPLAALPTYKRLHQLVERMTQKLPSSMALLRVIMDIRDRTWAGLKDILSKWVALLTPEGPY